MALKDILDEAVSQAIDAITSEIFSDIGGVPATQIFNPVEKQLLDKAKTRAMKRFSEICKSQYYDYELEVSKKVKQCKKRIEVTLNQQIYQGLTQKRTEVLKYLQGKIRSEISNISVTKLG